MKWHADAGETMRRLALSRCHRCQRDLTGFALGWAEASGQPTLCDRCWAQQQAEQKQEATHGKSR